MFIISRYLSDYLLSVAALIISWIGIMWFLDGAIVWASFFVVLIWAIAYIPYRLRSDYLRVKGYLKSILAFKKGKLSKTEFIEKTVVLASEETGIPENIIYFFVRHEKTIKQEMT